MEGLERVERLLALLLIRTHGDDPQANKAYALSRAGFSNAEIAELLGTTSAVIGQQLYEIRKNSKKSSKARK